MKFGRNLPRNQVPEWASQYINYKALKKLIKNAQEEEKNVKGQPDLAGFLYSLDRNLEDVDHFYNKKYQDLARRLKLLEDRYGVTTAVEAADELEQEDREDLLAALLELRSQFRKLQWYGEVNRRGFVKITKKLDKKVQSSHAQQKYLTLKVGPCPFATNTELFKALEKINVAISSLSAAAERFKATPSDQQHHDGSAGGGVAPKALRRSGSNKSLRIADDSFAAIELLIRQDDEPKLATTLSELRQALTDDVPEHKYQQFLKGLLQRAIFARSRRCVLGLLHQIVFLDDAEDINRRNCIHRLVISIGRTHADADKQPGDVVVDAEAELYSFITPAASPAKVFRHLVAKENERARILTRQDVPIAFFAYVLDSLTPTQQSALMSKDSAGRTPLHFAAEYGVRVLVEVIIEHLQKWNMFNVDEGIDGPCWQDNEGWAPLHLSVIGGHPLTTKALLDAEEATLSAMNRSQIRHNSPKSSAVLGIATKANYVEVVRILVGARVDINFQDEYGETALHVAARFGHLECASILLCGSDVQRIDTERQEATYGWTPVFIASVDGHLPIIELLIEAGADVDKLDWSGWSAKEHAALRGHITLAKRLAEVTMAPANLVDSASSSPPKPNGLTERTSNLANNNNNNNNNNSNNHNNAAVIAQPQTPPTKLVSDAVKTFGHRYLKDKAMILVSLGSMDMRKNAQAVSLDHIPLTNASSTQLDTALSVIVSAKGAEGESEVFDLPVQDNISTEPIVFHSADPTKVKLLFDLVPTYAGSAEAKVGRGVAMLSSIKPDIGKRRMALQGDISVPIVAATDMEVIGSITFNFLIITPFKHPKMTITQEQTYWKTVAQTMVIGHRGLGKNFASGRRSLQLGENTVQSFIAAANLGASYVEFDVQLTKDHVPVIYHDFLVSETGVDAPVHTLTLEQFLHVNEVRTPRHHSRAASPSPSGHPRLASLKGGLPERPGWRHRSMSVGGGSREDVTTEMEERMKHTRDFKNKGFKGNSRGSHIQAPFATLEELFKKLPSHVGFNIEMKYPMLSESQSEEMDDFAIELNTFVDTVLEKVYDLGSDRNIMFSSFNPDICLLLSYKQPSIPVLFLTDAGASPVADIRASSLQEAIRFASRWGLLGVVSASQPFVIAPRLVRVVKESGLVCVSYGAQNNENENVRLQVAQGIDAVIVDSVLNIRTGLQADEEKKTRERQTSLTPTPRAGGEEEPLGSNASTASTDDMPLSSASSALGGGGGGGGGGPARFAPSVTSESSTGSSLLPDVLKDAAGGTTVEVPDGTPRRRCSLGSLA